MFSRERGFFVINRETFRLSNGVLCSRGVALAMANIPEACVAFVLFLSCAELLEEKERKKNETVRRFRCAVSTPAQLFF